MCIEGERLLTREVELQASRVLRVAHEGIGEPE